MSSEGNPQNAIQTEESNTLERSFRDDPQWTKLYKGHIAHLAKTYRQVNADGEPVTEEWLHDEAEKMADVQYKMKMRQKALEHSVIALQPKDSTRISEYEKKKLEKQKEEGNPYAGKVLDLFEDK